MSQSVSASSREPTALKSGAVDESEFEIEPVAGHWVEDMRTGRRYLQSETQLKWYQSYTVWVVFLVLVLAFLGFRRSKLA